ncbi:MAG: CaiB/BaiF CoA transferase family protein, partial [Janthinobacterium lividum]
MNDPADADTRGAAASEAAAAKPLPLAGIRVLDVTQVMAGPFCSMLLADLGADVIKVEPPGTGDQTRGAMGFKMKGPDSMGFLNLNRNKRSIAINLKSEAGRGLFEKMAATADVLVENYRPGVMQRLGLGYEAMRAINPGLIYASISGFGQSGPWAKRPGFDLMAQAMSGIMSVTGHPGGPPVKAGVPVADIGCALFATYAILSAYIGREKTGDGQYIDASLFDAALAFSIWDISEYWGTGRIPQPVGTSNRMSAPYQAVQASDGYFVMGATNQKLWTLLCGVLDRRELLDDARFIDISARLANREVLIDELEKSFA